MRVQRFWDLPIRDPQLRRRGQIIISVSVLLVAILLLALPLVLLSPDPLPSTIAVVIAFIMIGIALLLTRRGTIDPAGWILVLLSAAVVTLPSLLRREISSSAFYLIVPILIGSVVLRPIQVWLALAGAYSAVALLAWRGEAPGGDELAILQNIGLLLFFVAGIGYISARLTQQSLRQSAAAQQLAEQAATMLEQTNKTLEAQVAERTMALSNALADVEQRAAVQARLLEEVNLQRETIREMSTPVLPVLRQVLVMPLIGAMDTARLQALQEQALAAIQRAHARWLFLDITGVPIVDTQVARGLINVVESARLLGAEVALIGIRPEVAQTLVSLGVDLSRVQTLQDLETALARVFAE